MGKAAADLVHAVAPTRAWALVRKDSPKATRVWATTTSNADLVRRRALLVRACLRASMVEEFVLAGVVRAARGEPHVLSASSGIAHSAGSKSKFTKQLGHRR